MLSFGKEIDEKSGEVTSGYLRFDSGKKIILTKDECLETDNKFRLLIAEGKSNRQIGTGGLKFICPECGSHRLECCEEGTYSSEVLNIDEEGDFDYGDIDADGVVDRFQCLNCGYILSREDGSSIDENDEVVEWIKERQ